LTIDDAHHIQHIGAKTAGEGKGRVFTVTTSPSQPAVSPILWKSPSRFSNDSFGHFSTVAGEKIADERLAVAGNWPNLRPLITVRHLLSDDLRRKRAPAAAIQ